MLLELGVFAATLTRQTAVSMADFERLLFPELSCAAQLGSDDVPPLDPIGRARPFFSYADLHLWPGTDQGSVLILPKSEGPGLNRFAHLAASLGLGTWAKPLKTCGIYSRSRAVIEINDRAWSTSRTTVDELIARLLLRHEADHAVRAAEFLDCGFAPLFGSLEMNESSAVPESDPWHVYDHWFSLDEFVVYARDLYIALWYFDSLWTTVDASDRLKLADYVRGILDLLGKFAERTFDVLKRDSNEIRLVARRESDVPNDRPWPWYALVQGDIDHRTELLRPIPPALAYRAEAHEHPDPVLLDFIADDIFDLRGMARYVRSQVGTLGKFFEDVNRSGDPRGRRDLVSAAHELAPVLVRRTRPRLTDRALRSAP